MIVREIEQRIEANEAKATVAGEIESLSFWIHAFQYYLLTEEVPDQAEVNAFRFSIADHKKALGVALGNNRWFDLEFINTKTRHTT